jgi:hypothetical protein
LVYAVLSHKKPYRTIFCLCDINFTPITVFCALNADIKPFK